MHLSENHVELFGVYVYDCELRATGDLICPIIFRRDCVYGPCRRRDGVRSRKALHTESSE